MATFMSGLRAVIFGGVSQISSSRDRPREAPQMTFPSQCTTFFL